MRRGNETDGLGSDEMVIMPLGAGNEVGRSCIIMKFKGKTIMVHQFKFMKYDIKSGVA